MPAHQSPPSCHFPRGLQFLPRYPDPMLHPSWDPACYLVTDCALPWAGWLLAGSPGLGSVSGFPGHPCALGAPSFLGQMDTRISHYSHDTVRSVLELRYQKNDRNRLCDWEDGWGRGGISARKATKRGWCHRSRF